MRNLKKEQFGGLRPLAVFSIDIALVGVIKISSLPYEWIIRRTSYEISTTLLNQLSYMKMSSFTKNSMY